MEVLAAGTGDGGVFCLRKKRPNPLLEDEVYSGPECIGKMSVLDPHVHEHRRRIVAL